MKIEITEKKLKAAIQIAFAECGLEDENLENLIIRYTKGLSVFGVKQLSTNEDKVSMFCECGGNERVALDCTMKPCKHPKYFKG